MSVFHGRQRIGTAIAIVVLAASSSGLGRAGAQTAVPAPVTIESCSPLASQRDLGAPGSTFSPAPTLIGSAAVPALSDGMSVTFVNHGTKVANLVNVVVDGPQTHFVIRDAGTFSPGVSITNTFRSDPGTGNVLPTYISPAVRCRVSVVAFADGSIWRYGQVVPAASGPYHLVATPDRARLQLGAEASLLLVTAPAAAAGFRESDTCTGIASVTIGAAGDAQITYTIRPLAKGSCVARVTSENGSSVSIPVVVR